MLDRLNNYDWNEAFHYAKEPTVVCPPGYKTSDIIKTGFTEEDVKFIIAMVDGENDGDEWVGCFLLHDGRWASLRAGCDYSGWD